MFTIRERAQFHLAFVQAKTVTFTLLLHSPYCYILHLIPATAVFLYYMLMITWY